MRQSIVFLLAAQMMVLACESSPKGSKTPPTEPPSETVAAAPMKAPMKAPSLSGIIDVETQPMRVAMLVGNEPLSMIHPSEYCLDDGKLYTGARFRLGTVNVFGLDEALVAMDRGSIVAAWGETKTGLDKMLRAQGPCPMDYQPMHGQMRSDWIAPEGGPNTTRAKLAGLSYVVGSKAIALSMAEFLPSDEAHIRVRLRNPFSLALIGLNFFAHYEGGRGRPMPNRVEKVLVLEAGASVEIELPRMLDNEDPRSKAGSELHSLRLQGRLGMADLDIKIFVPHTL